MNHVLVNELAVEPDVGGVLCSGRVHVRDPVAIVVRVAPSVRVGRVAFRGYVLVGAVVVTDSAIGPAGSSRTRRGGTHRRRTRQG